MKERNKILEAVIKTELKFLQFNWKKKGGGFFFSFFVLFWMYLHNIFMLFFFFQANRFKNLKINLRLSPYNFSQGIRVESHALKSMPASKTDYAVNVLSVTVTLSPNSDAPVFLKKKKQTKPQ